jgi:3-phosphoshikimate 1-carboxyvinyltransferase
MRSVRPPGDKSISHRALILSALADGESRIRNLLLAEDIQATARALRGVGVPVPRQLEGELQIHGPASFRDATGPIDCGNSGTTARLMLGLIAGAGVTAQLDGDGSLRSRPMDRICYPLQAMGARIRYTGQRDRLPVEVMGRVTGSLRPLRHRPRIASAQVKSGVLLAGLAGRVNVEVLEPGNSRDHTERMLAAMGAPLTVAAGSSGPRVTLLAGEAEWDGALAPLDFEVPGDPSSAAFLIAAAVLTGRELRVEGVALNPTRIGFIETLERMGVQVDVRRRSQAVGEPTGDLTVGRARPAPFDIGPEQVPRLLDEVPVLSVLAARADGVSRIRGAAELRVKESDRLAVVARNLQSLGVECREYPDGLDVVGTTDVLEGRVEVEGDHRIAMAFGALALDPDTRIEVSDPGCVHVSYPGFWEELESLK